VITKKHRFQASSPRNAEGFTLIEVMISMVVLTIGLLSLLGVFGMAMASTQTSQQNGVAKQNTGSGGIFIGGLNPIYNPGNDGIPDTADDSSAGYQTLQLPGPDGIFGTSDDVSQPLSNYQRQIQIDQVLDGAGTPIGTLRLVTITIQYTTPQFRFPKTYILSTYISEYR